MVRRTLAVLTLVCALVGVSALPALAGSPHFVDDTVVATVDGATLTVSGKEAGLGDESQIHIVVSATAACVNPGGNKPSAGNKETFTAEGDFPVQNGKATFSLTLTATFQPSCSPPMSVVWSGGTVTDTTSGISETF